MRVFLKLSLDDSYLKLTAKQGHAHAQCNLGICFEDGYGVEQNAEEAVRLYRLAAEQGDAEAQSNMDELECKDEPPAKRVHAECERP